MVSALEKNRAGKEDGECWVGEQSHREGALKESLEGNECASHAGILRGRG